MAIMRLDKFLSNMGVESRKGVRTYLREGAVTVDGVEVREQDFKVDTDKNIIKLYDEEIRYKKYIYLMMNKPAGVISATDDPREIDETVLDLVPEEFLYYDVFPVGRLDRDTEGLLILSNDGIFSHRVLSPKKHVEKEYYATINGNITERDIMYFRTGVKLDDGYICKPAEIRIIEEKEKDSIVSVTIIEGKYHQVKRMFDSIGKPVTYLKRVKFAGIPLDENLAKGETRELDESEMQIIVRYITAE